MTPAPPRSAATTATVPRRLRPTLRHSRAGHYRRPGGPWTVGSLDALLSTPAARRGHRVVDGGRRWGGSELAGSIDDLAGRLRRAGVRRGDAVAWQLPNGLVAMVLFRACWRLGAVATPIHPSAGPAELASALEQASPRLVLGGPGSPAADVGGAVRLGEAGDISAALPAGAPVPPGASGAHPADLALVVFTSGSTGRPKAVLHTQRGLAWKAKAMALAHGLVPADAALVPAPMAHISGLLNGVLLPAATGMTSVLMARWDPEQAVDLIEAERISFMAGPPTFFVSLLGAGTFRTDRVGTLRLVSSGGAPVTPAFVAATSEALGCRVKRTYGSSEAPMVTTSYPGDDRRRAGDTDGRAVGEVELRVVDPAGGRRRPPGSTGELWVRGPELFVGYADPQETTASHARGGWFRTGDLATVDEDGWLQVVGRLKDVIIRGGENISVSEVEGTLEAHPAVRQAMAVGYPDPVMGERVAVVVVAPDSFDLATCRRWFATRGLARYKVPERLIHLAALPILPSGKADRAAVRALADGPAE